MLARMFGGALTSRQDDTVCAPVRRAPAAAPAAQQHLALAVSQPLLRKVGHLPSPSRASPCAHLALAGRLLHRPRRHALFHHPQLLAGRAVHPAAGPGGEAGAPARGALLRGEFLAVVLCCSVGAAQSQGRPAARRECVGVGGRPPGTILRHEDSGGSARRQEPGPPSLQRPAARPAAPEREFAPALTPRLDRAHQASRGVRALTRGALTRADARADVVTPRACPAAPEPVLGLASAWTSRRGQRFPRVHVCSHAPKGVLTLVRPGTRVCGCHAPAPPHAARGAGGGAAAARRVAARRHHFSCAPRACPHRRTQLEGLVAALLPPAASLHAATMDRLLSTPQHKRATTMLWEVSISNHTLTPNLTLTRAGAWHHHALGGERARPRAPSLALAPARPGAPAADRRWRLDSPGAHMLGWAWHGTPPPPPSLSRGGTGTTCTSRRRMAASLEFNRPPHPPLARVRCVLQVAFTEPLQPSHLAGSWVRLTASPARVMLK